jgi:hypothetical protein
VYAALTGDDIELAVAIDGHLSLAHELALDESGGPARLESTPRRRTQTRTAHNLVNRYLIFEPGS